jgi:hypothetical protein
MFTTTILSIMFPLNWHLATQKTVVVIGEEAREPLIGVHVYSYYRDSCVTEVNLNGTTTIEQVSYFDTLFQLEYVGYKSVIIDFDNIEYGDTIIMRPFAEFSTGSHSIASYKGYSYKWR